MSGSKDKCALAGFLIERVSTRVADVCYIWCVCMSLRFSLCGAGALMRLRMWTIFWPWGARQKAWALRYFSTVSNSFSFLPSVCLPVHVVCVYVCLHVLWFACMSAHVCICLSVYLSICLSVCLSVHLSVCASVCLCICLSVYLSRAFISSAVPSLLLLTIFSHIFSMYSMHPSIFPSFFSPREHIL